MEDVVKKKFNGSFEQFWVLLKHFVVRLLNNDVLKFENESRERIIILMVLLGSAGGLVAQQLLTPYLIPLLTGANAGGVWIEKNVFVTMSMALTGILTVLNWDNIFPDRKDFFNLMSLPIKKSTFFLAKFVSLLVFVGMITLAFDALALFIFAFFLADILQVGVLNLGFAYLFTNFLGNLFVFLAVAGIQSIFTIIFRNKFLKRIANRMQWMLLVGFISLLVYLPQISKALPGARKAMSSLMYYFPPIWFTGVFERMVRNHDAVFSSHLTIASVGLLVVLGLYAVSFPLAFNRFMKTDSNGNGKRRFLKLRKLSSRTFQFLFLRHPIQLGMFYFILYTLKRSMRHKLRLAMYMAVPVGYFFTNILYFYSVHGWEYFKKPGMFLAGMPLVMFLALVVGVRMIVKHPVAINANWVFRLTEEGADQKKYYIKGIKKALILFGGAPIFILMLLFYSYCWGLMLGLLHSLYCGAIFLVLLELFFSTYKKIPFAAVCDPGKPNIKAYWLVYLVGFLQGFAIFSQVGLILLSAPGFYWVFFALAIILHTALVFKRYRYYEEQDFYFIYDEEPTEVMLTLKTA
jgi:hypothetical protein